ncbi:MAG: YHS domain-containing protein [Nitrospira sp.]
MYRLFLISALLVLFYYLLRRAIRKVREGGGAVSLREGQAPGKQMIQDPVCRVFIPRENAIRREIGGQTYFFCSQNCATTFERKLTSQQPE